MSTTFGWLLALAAVVSAPFCQDEGLDPEEEEEPEEEKPAPPPPPPAQKPMRATVPGTTISVCVAPRDFRPDPPEDVGPAMKAEPILLFGHLGEGRITLSLTAVREDAKHPAAERREREGKGIDPPPALFEVAGVPCHSFEAVYPEAPGAKQVHMHAYPAAAGWSFDLHVSSVSFEGKPGLARADFEELVRSLRFGWFRRGLPDLLPAAVLDAMDGAARKSPGEVRFLEEACRTRPADGAARLSLGEALLAADRPEPALAAFEKAVELLAPGAEAAAPKEERFALWLALDGAASCLLRAAKPDRARLHLARARDLAAALGVKEVRGATAYALARCAGEKGEGSVAGTLLAEAIALDPSLRAAAKEDPSFRKVKLNREFKAAVGE